MMLSFAAVGTMLVACNEQYHAENHINQETVATSVSAYHAPVFAEPDEAKELDGIPAENLKKLFEATGPEIITSMGRLMSITDEQLQEIAAFTSNLVSGKSTQTEKYQAIFDWVKQNIKYELSDNNPYAVFKNRKGVCQGYANLQTVMCYSQGIPAVVVNGLSNKMGHAWTYTCPDGKWKVSDPTNKAHWDMSDVQGYAYGWLRLEPKDADVELFKDDYAVYRYYDYEVNVDKVTTTNSVFVVPYSVGGFVIGSFNPMVALPPNVTELYVGANIKTFGKTDESNGMQLEISNFGKYLHAVHIDESNARFLSHKGVVYEKKGKDTRLHYIPGGITYIELLPMELVKEATIKDNNNVETICFLEGTKEFENYAIEKCSKLRRVYIPEDAVWNEKALYNCPEDVEVIRGVPSGIKHVTM